MAPVHLGRLEHTTIFHVRLRARPVHSRTRLNLPTLQASVLLSLVDQTACHHTARLDAVVPNFSALETPTPFRAGIFLSYSGQLREWETTGWFLGELRVPT